MMKYYQGKLDPNDHRILKAAAAMKGQSMEAYTTQAIFERLARDGFKNLPETETAEPKKQLAN